ncbi:hypothetical protein EDB83DRAFT_2554346 [Lactarius deliciosus]|nr:hypothetical protein EDB83DRAFT_2554346 [Lactarius deliciosus]
MSLASLLASVVPGLLPHGSSPPLQATATLARKTRYAPQHTHHASLLPMFTFYVQLHLSCRLFSAASVSGGFGGLLADPSGSGPEITHFRYFRSRSGITWLDCHISHIVARRH